MVEFIGNNNSGIILIVTIWILIILTILAVGIGHRNSIGVKLSQYSIDRLKSYYIAKAGLQVAIKELQNDTNDYDTLYECGFSLDEEETPAEIFKEIPISDGYYTVAYQRDTEDGPSLMVYGLADEERKINLNAINKQNYLILENLLVLLGIDSEIAKTIASSVVDWHDDDSDVTNPGYGAEDDYYMDLEKPYHCKNYRFESTEELLLIKDVSEDIFLKLKDYISIYPLAQMGLKVNVNTANSVVLQALARAAAELDGNPATELEEADSVAEKIVDYRAGDDKIEATEDDRMIDIQNPEDLDLFGAEKSLFIYLRNNFLVKESHYFCAKIQGVYKQKKAVTNLEVIFSDEGLTPIYWHEN
jgi:general secretion pathway protein K